MINWGLIGHFRAVEMLIFAIEMYSRAVDMLIIAFEMYSRAVVMLIITLEMYSRAVEMLFIAVDKSDIPLLLLLLNSSFFLAEVD